MTSYNDVIDVRILREVPVLVDCIHCRDLSTLLNGDLKFKNIEQFTNVSMVLMNLFFTEERRNRKKFTFFSSIQSHKP